MDSAPVRKRVLLVAADPQALVPRATALHDAGYDVVGCGTAADALEAARQTPPALVITDMESPGVDGFALAHDLRADRRTRHVPVIAMTSGWTSNTRARAQRAGIGVLLLKPCAPEHLLAEIERALQVRLASHTPVPPSGAAPRRA